MIKLPPEGIGSQDSPALGERNLAPLPWMFQNIQNAEPSIIPTMALRFSHKELNDTMETKSLIPTLLTYERISVLPATFSQFPGQQVHMRVPEIARREIKAVVAQLRISQSMCLSILAAANYILNRDDRVRVFLETDRSINGPYIIIRVEFKQVFIDRDVSLRRHNISKFIPEQLYSVRDHLSIIIDAQNHSSPPARYTNSSP